jgi:thiol-disulfide isomerase/thioredoxin
MIPPYHAGSAAKLIPILLTATAFASALFLSGCKQPPAGTHLLGKTIEIQGQAVDGREVDLAKQRGKVVLIDFWATWCPPCVEEVPRIKAAYEQWHNRGFEIIGINLDDKKEDLLSFLNRNKMEWPQYFDGLDNRLAQQFGIEELPTMWLIDKQGKLRDIDAVQNLSEKVEKLLAETGP